MKAAEFPVVAEAHRAARGHLKFFNTMMSAKSASTAAGHKQQSVRGKSTGSSPPTKKK